MHHYVNGNFDRVKVAEKQLAIN